MSDYKRLQYNLDILEKHNEIHTPVFHLTDGETHEQDLVRELIADCRELLNKIQNGTLIELPCLLTPYYLSGEWHCKILKGFDEHSVPCMEYFHGKTKEEVENKAKKKLKS